MVLKSLFEEQITLDAQQMGDGGYFESEVRDYLTEYIRGHKISDYIQPIRDTKKECKIPVIASINCYSTEGWIDFAREIERAGADALEINILAVQTAVEYQYGEFEQRHIDTLMALKKVVSLPIIMKLGSNFTNPVPLVDQLYANGAAAVVMFNRPYQPDMDIDKMVQSAGDVFSAPSELSNSLRWIGITSALVSGVDYAASCGVHTAEAVIKSILSGASVVEVCTAIYTKGSQSIVPMLDFIRRWINEKGFETIDQFKGKVNSNDLNAITTFERTQFMRYYGEKSRLKLFSDTIQMPDHSLR